MKIGIRELALLSVGCVVGVIVAVFVPTTTRPHVTAVPTSPPVQNSPTQPVRQADAATQSYFNTLLAATAADDYEQFVSVAHDAFRRRVSPTAFHSISQSLAPRMQAGYTPTYLGELQQKGGQISLWRLAFADGGDDRLARMSLTQDRVDGFLITPAF